MARVCVRAAKTTNTASDETNYGRIAFQIIPTAMMQLSAFITSKPQKLVDLREFDRHLKIGNKSILPTSNKFDPATFFFTVHGNKSVTAWVEMLEGGKEWLGLDKKAGDGDGDEEDEDINSGSIESKAMLIEKWSVAVRDLSRIKRILNNNR